MFTITYIEFSHNSHYCDFRADLNERYKRDAVSVGLASFRPGRTVAKVTHLSGLGAEIRGRAFGHFAGTTCKRVMMTTPDGCPYWDFVADED